MKEEKEEGSQKAAGKKRDGATEEYERKGRKTGRDKKSVERRGQCPCRGCPQPPQACWGPGGSPNWSPALQPRLSPGQGWLHNGGGRRPAGCHVGAGVGAAPRRGWDSAPARRPERSQMLWLAAVKGAGSCQQQGSGRGPPAAGWPDGCNMHSGDRVHRGVSAPSPGHSAGPLPLAWPPSNPARLCVGLGESAAPQILLLTWRWCS